MAEWVEDSDFVEEKGDDDDDDELIESKEVHHKTKCLMVKHDSLENKCIRILHSVRRRRYAFLFFKFVVFTHKYTYREEMHLHSGYGQQHLYLPIIF